MDWLFPAALALTGTMGVLMSLWGLWYLVSGLACVRKPTDYGFHPARTKFAILIAARNEELVVALRTSCENLSHNLQKRKSV